MVDFEANFNSIVQRQKVKSYWRNAQDSWIDEEISCEALMFVTNLLRTEAFNNTVVTEDPIDVLEKLKTKHIDHTDEKGVMKKSPFVCIGETDSGELSMISLVSVKPNHIPFSSVHLKFAVPLCGNKKIESDEEPGQFSRFALMTGGAGISGGLLLEILNCDDLRNTPKLFEIWVEVLSSIRDCANYVAREFHKKYNSPENSKKWWL